MAKSQDELRKLMRQKMGDAAAPESPLAKVSTSGKISCVLCPGVPIKNWTTHSLSAAHKRSIQAQKAPKPPPVQQTERKLPPKVAPDPPKVPDPPAQPPKSILKNPLKLQKASKPSEVPAETTTSGSLKRPASPSPEEPDEKVSKSEEVPGGVGSSGELPEGFFDDPKLDAKARNIEYRDPVEVEWENFQKALREENMKSEQVIEVDDVRDMKEREINETDEMISNWEKVRELEVRREQLDLKKSTADDEEMEEDEVEEAEFEEFLSWRQKAVK